jgi:hypothetical protein
MMEGVGKDKGFLECPVKFGGRARIVDGGLRLTEMTEAHEEDCEAVIPDDFQVVWAVNII